MSRRNRGDATMKYVSSWEPELFTNVVSLKPVPLSSLPLYHSHSICRASIRFLKHMFPSSGMLTSKWHIRLPTQIWEWYDKSFSKLVIHHSRVSVLRRFLSTCQSSFLTYVGWTFDIHQVQSEWWPVQVGDWFLAHFAVFHPFTKMPLTDYHILTGRCVNASGLTASLLLETLIITVSYIEHESITPELSNKTSLEQLWSAAYTLYESTIIVWIIKYWWENSCTQVLHVKIGRYSQPCRETHDTSSPYHPPWTIPS